MLSEVERRLLEVESAVSKMQVQLDECTKVLNNISKKVRQRDTSESPAPQRTTDTY